MIVLSAVERRTVGAELPRVTFVARIFLMFCIFCVDEVRACVRAFHMKRRKSRVFVY